MSKRLVIILPQLTPGGTERSACELANYLTDKKGVEVILLLMYHSKIFFDLNQSVKVIMPEENMRKRLGRLAYIPYLLYFIRKNIKRLKPSRTLCLGYILFSLIASLKIKTKVIISFRCNPYIKRFGNNKLLNNVYHLLHKLLRFRVDGFIAQTNEAKAFYSKRYNVPLVVIPNFLKFVNHKNTFEKKNNIVFLGRLAPVKNPIDLLKAFSRINNKHNWQLHYLGDGILKSKLKKMINELGMANQVFIHGFVKDVDFQLSQSKILGLTSKSEGFPNAIIEAMANKMAIVAYDCKSGPSDIINDGKNGFLIPVADVITLKEKLEYLINQPQHIKKMSDQAFEDSKKYDIDKIGSRYYDFIFHEHNSKSRKNS